VILNDYDRISANNNDVYEFKLYTPWKFGLSAGHTIGSMLALGLSYEYSDYGSLDSRYKTGSSYNWYYDSYSESSESDKEMNRHTERTLKGVSTIKVGAEMRPIPEMKVRLGYNYVSPKYEKEGFKDGTIASTGSYISSATDYTNWEETHRITCGLGYAFGPLDLSVAYQYSTTNGQFSPFMNGIFKNDFISDENIARSVSVSDKRHQIMMTLGYSF
jgi:opacity protein-like surface antigen